MPVCALADRWALMQVSNSNGTFIVLDRNRIGVAAGSMSGAFRLAGKAIPSIALTECSLVMIREVQGWGKSLFVRRQI